MWRNRLHRSLGLIIGGTLVSAALYLGGCGSSPKPPLDISDIPVPSADLAQKIFDEATVSCADPACGKGVGMLVSISQKPVGVGMCTAFLIAPNLAMTNSHCIPDDLKRPGSSCTDRIKILFPGSKDEAAESISCSRVLKASNIAETAPREHQDYAFLELSRSSTRPPLAISTSGITDGMELTNIRMDPVSSTRPDGMITEDQCTAIQGTEVVPTFDEPIGPLITLGGCQVRHGNSGSPLLGRDGKVHALLQGEFDPGPDSVWRKYQSDWSATLSIGTNLGCVDRPDSSFRPDGVKCSRFPRAGHEAEDLDAGLATLTSEVKAELDSQLASWQGAHPSILRWHASQRQDLSPSGEQDRFYAPEPTCFVKPESWLKRYRHFLIYSQDAELVLTLPTWKVQAKLDRFFKPAQSLERDDDRAITIRFNPRALHRTQRSEVGLLERDASSLQMNPVYSGTVPSCPAVALQAERQARSR